MTSPTYDHLTDEELFEDIDGHPSARMTEHCAVCPACRALRQQMSDTLGALRFEPEPALSGDVRERLMRRHAHAHRPRPAIQRLVAYRVPLYQVAAAVAAVALLFVGINMPRPSPRHGTFPPFVAAVSDLWAQPSFEECDTHAGFRGDSPDRTPPDVALMPNRPPLELGADVSDISTRHRDEGR
ncbi:MAG: hypothetical protein MUE60_02520 [Candidatus Eisenbacteria bacterium]|jgi:anti-sigma factor RsiW|nr:hypothetical protein [Candidatus Eisenbacteria bacterium]